MTFIEDVESLKKSPLPEVRQTIATKICDYYNKGVFEAEEEKIASEIIRLFARDIEIRVRKALAETLKNNPNIPHDVALRLANDKLDVALPILVFSEALTEGDLLEIIKSTENIGKLIAITKREKLSEPLSSALIHKRIDEVCSSLFSNNKALISQEAFLVAIEEFAKNEDVVNSLINRGGLSVKIVEKMISLTTDELKTKIESKLNDKGEIPSNIEEEVREKVTLGLLSDEPITQEALIKAEKEQQQKATKKPEELAKHLFAEKKLTSSIILRSICEGNLDFFEASLATTSNIPLINIRALVRTADRKALSSIFERSDFPISSVDAICVILEFIKQERYEAKAFDQNTKQKLIEYIEANKYDSSVPLMPYLIALISSDLTLSNVTS